MSKMSLLGTVVILLVSGLGTPQLFSQDRSSSDSTHRILVVDDDLRCPRASFSTIQSAVDAAQAGDTVRVCAGEYQEEVFIRKPLRLITRGQAKVILHGFIVVTGMETIDLDGVVVEINGFAIDVEGTRHGITIENTPRVLIRNNTVFGGTRAGIEIFESDDGVVARNTVRNNATEGIRVIEAFDYDLRQNVTHENGTTGILVNEGARNVLRLNAATNNQMHGINVCEDTRDNRVERNAARDNGDAGLAVCQFASGTVLTNNKSFGNGIDALDESSGDGTAGTDSFWRNNACDSSSPNGLCRRSGPSNHPAGAQSDGR
jgi:parallel beta-helix repeat protein